MYRQQYKQLLWSTDEEKYYSLLQKFCPGDVRAKKPRNNDEEDDYESGTESDVELSDDDDAEAKEIEWEDKFKDYFFRYHSNDVSKYYRGAIAKYGIFNSYSGVTTNPSENLNSTIKTVVVQPNSTLYGCVNGLHIWQNRLASDINRAVVGLGDFRLKQEAVSAATRADSIQVKDLEDKFEAREEEEEDQEMTNIEDDVNRSCKETVALLYHRHGLIQSLYTKDGVPTGAYEVETHFHKSAYVSYTSLEMM